MLAPIIVWMSYLLLNHKISYSSEQGPYSKEIEKIFNKIEYQ